MTGTVQVIVQNNRVQYKFELNRNITVLRGDSATGKTTLIDLIASYMSNGEESGITITCSKRCYVLNGPFWEQDLKTIKDAIVFIDEGNKFLITKEFARAIKHSDNYYVIATREALPNLPYSVDEIYTIKNKTRGYGVIKRIYSSFDRIYTKQPISLSQVQHVIVEDTNSGFTFFKEFFLEKGIECISAKGKSNIAKLILSYPKDEHVLVIADGAAFGPEMERIAMTSLTHKVMVYLPESFEWLIMKSGLIEGVTQILDSPSDYIESKQYFSWEQFFTKLLVNKTKNTYLAYNKKTLNPNFLNKKEKNAITTQLPKV